MLVRSSRRTARLGLIGLGLLIAALFLALPGLSSGSFSGTNGKVFYDQGGKVWSINPDGTENVELISNATRPSASADGTKVVFQSFRDGGWNIFEMNADGSGLVDLTRTEAPVINFEPALSPDGSRVVFMRQNLTPGEQDLWTIGSDGTGAVNLTNSPEVNETSAEYSPDGTKIVFASSGPKPSDVNYDVWVMDADGSNRTQLTETAYPTENTSPTWSPDSTKIAYSVTESSTPADNGLHVMNADGTAKTPILNSGNPIPSGALSWSPDGTRIAYEAATLGYISTVAAGGGASTSLVAKADAHYPSWVPAPSTTPIGGSEPPGTGTGPAPIISPPPTSPPPTSPSTPTTTPSKPKPKPKPLKCGKGKKKKVVKGKARCVKAHHHKAHKKKHR